MVCVGKFVHKKHAILFELLEFTCRPYALHGTLTYTCKIGRDSRDSMAAGARRFRVQVPESIRTVQYTFVCRVMESRYCTG
jgi:hypothetical protein